MASPSTRLVELPTYSSASNSRLQSLYSDLWRQKASNFAAFQSNVDWWRRTLESLVSSGLQQDSRDVLLLHASSDLAGQFKREGRKPLGLPAVITELRSSRALIPLEQFLEAPQSIYDPGPLPYRVASYVVGRPLWWGLQQLGFVGDAPGTSSTDAWRGVRGSYVVVRNVEEAAEAVLQRHRAKAGASPADDLYSSESFRREYGGVGAVLPDVALSERDLKVVVKHLGRDRGVLVSDKEVIKFVDDSATRSITIVDRGILELKLGVENLESQVDQLQRKIQERTQKAIDALRAKNKDIAMAHLRSRKLFEDTLVKRLGSLEILQTTLTQVETAAGDIEIMKSYEASTATLRTLLAHPSLQRDAVDATMDALAEAAADQRGVDEAIRAGACTEDVDEDALEAELRGLVAEAKAEDAKREGGRVADGARLPDAPSGRVGQVEQALASSGTGVEAVGWVEDVHREKRWEVTRGQQAAPAQHDREARNARMAQWEAEDAKALEA